MNDRPNTLPVAHDYYEIITKVASVKDVDIAKLKELMEIREQFLKRRAEEHWNICMAHAQGEMAPVSKDMANPATRSRYASLAAVDNAIRPIYTKHGFGISYDEVPYEKENWIHLRADVSNGAFTKHYHRFLPWTTQGIGGRQAMTATHANMGANTYGRRALLKNIFNLAEEDDDGNAAGGRMAQRTAYGEPGEEPPRTQQADVSTVDPETVVREIALKFQECQSAEQLAQYKKLVRPKIDGYLNDDQRERLNKAYELRKKDVTSEDFRPKEQSLL